MNNKQAHKAINQSMAKFRGFASKLSFAFAAASGLFFKQGIQSVSDFAEAQDSLNKLIGADGTQAITKFSKTASKNFGLAQSEVLTIANNFAGLFRQIPKESINAGEALIKLQQRVSDLGSQFNKSTELIFTGLQSGLSGKLSLVLKQMGIFLDATSMQTRMLAGEFEHLGYNSNTAFSSLTQGEQVLVRYHSFLKQSEAVTGNFADTLGISMPNQIKRMKAEFTNASAAISKSLIPLVTKLVTSLANLAEWLKQNEKLVLGLMGAFIGFKLGRFVGEMLKLIALLTAAAIGKTAAQTGVFSLAAIPAVVGALGLAIGGILGAVGLSMGSSGSSSTPKKPVGTSASTVPVVNIEMNSITGEVGMNHATHNMQSNLGRGGN